MSDIAQLQADYNALETELRQVEQQQAATPSGTSEWWDLQCSIGDLRTRKNQAEKAYLEAMLTVPGNHTGIRNRLYFLERELAPPRYALPSEDAP